MIYNFHGEGGPMGLTIYNKTDKPLFIDWKKSALIRNCHSTSLFNSNIEVVARAGTYTPVNSKYQNTSYSRLTGSFEMPAGMDLIPPASDIKKDLLTVQDAGAMNALTKDSGKLEKLTDQYGVTHKYTSFSFDKSRSPFQFSSFLTFVLGNNNAIEFYVQHSFYANQVLMSNNEPEAFSLYRPDGDNLYFKQAAAQGEGTSSPLLGGARSR